MLTPVFQKYSHIEPNRGGSASPVRIYMHKEKKHVKRFHMPFLLEHIGFEPTASTMRMWRAPSCANAP